MKIDFDRVKILRKEYKKQLYRYRYSLDFVLACKKALTTDIINNLTNAIVRKKGLLKLYQSYLKDTTSKLIVLKKKIKEAEREFNDYVNSFYIDFENHYGQPYKSHKIFLTYFTNSINLKVNMKYFYYNIKQINKQ